jgi:hypothetical protein
VCLVWTQNCVTFCKEIRIQGCRCEEMYGWRRLMVSRAHAPNLCSGTVLPHCGFWKAWQRNKFRVNPPPTWLRLYAWILTRTIICRTRNIQLHSIYETRSSGIQKILEYHYCLKIKDGLAITYLRSWALLEKLPIVQPLRNFPAF